MRYVAEDGRHEDLAKGQMTIGEIIRETPEKPDQLEEAHGDTPQVLGGLALQGEQTQSKELENPQ